MEWDNNDVTNMHQTLSKKIERLCKLPIARSQDEADYWQSNQIVYMQVKTDNINALPKNMEAEVDRVFAASLEFYREVISFWFKIFYEDIHESKYSELSKEENIHLEQEIKSIFGKLNSKSVTIDEKTELFFNYFDLLVNKMKKNEDWFMLYNLTWIGKVSDRMVWNVGILDLFAWQLPCADTRKKNSYLELAKIMTVFFFMEQIYHNEHIFLDRYNNKVSILPFEEIYNLDRIFAYYEYVTSISFDA